MTGSAAVDAPLVEPQPTAPKAPGSRRLDLAGLVAAITTVVGASLVRVVTQGFDVIAADDAAYIRVGRSLWELRGTRFTIRSWVYPLLTGGASLVAGGDDPFTGPRILGWTLATTALVLAIVFAFRLARSPAALVTAGVMLATPVLWRIVPSARVEVALMCSMMVLLLVMDTASPRRMLVGGILAGITLLVKETSAPLVFLPLAYLGTVPRAQWRRLATRYVLAFTVTVGWWFVTVLVLSGDIFPLPGFRQASNRGVPRNWDLNASAWLLIGAWIAAWLIVAIGRRRDPRARILVIAGLAFVPASAVAWANGLALRQFVPLVLLSCIALGVAVVDVVTAVVRRAPQGARRTVAAVAAVGVVAAVAVPIALTQDRTDLEKSPGHLDIPLAAWVNARPGEPVLVTTFKFRSQLEVRVVGAADLRRLRFRTSTRPPPLRPAVAVDVRADGYHSLLREELALQVRGADYLVLTGPARLGPIGLSNWLQEHGAELGITPVVRFGPPKGTPWVHVYRLDHPRVRDIPTVVSGPAAERMIADGGFRPVGPTVLAGTLGAFARIAEHVPPDQYETIRSRNF